MGVQRSRAAAESADVVLLVFDGSEHLTEQDQLVSKELEAMGFGSGPQEDDTSYRHGRPVIVVVNKADRPQCIERGTLQNLWPSSPVVSTSTLTGAGLPELEETLAELMLAGKTLHSASVLVTSARHQDALRRAAEHLRASWIPLEQRLPLDFVSIDLRAAYDALGEVTGETASDDLLDRIFHEFCIGK
jgi:tRNA modification GTPase